MFQSVFVYGLMSIVLYLGFIRNDDARLIPMYRHGMSRDNFIGSLIAYIVFAFFSGVRWDVGVDHLSYLDNYINISWYDGGMESGFTMLIKLFNSLNLPFYVFFAFIAFLQLFFATKFFRKRQYLISLFACLILLSGEYFSWMNGIRQQLVTCLFLFSISYCIIPRKLYLYICLILLCTFFHKSAIILLPLYCLTYLKADFRFLDSKWQLVFLGISLAVSESSVITSLISYLDPFLNAIGYGDKYSAEYLLSLENSSVNFGPRRAIVLAVDIVVIFYYNQLRLYYRSKDFSIAYVIYYAMLIIQPLFIESQLLSRIISYFTIFRPIVVTYLLYYLLTINVNNRNKFIGIIIIVLYILRLFIDIYADVGNHTSCVRYQFFFNKI